MKLTVVIVTLILMTLVDEGATWGSWRAPRWRAPRIRITLPPILKKICMKICTTKCIPDPICANCKLKCPPCKPICTYNCKPSCRWLGRKRSEPQIKEEPGSFLVTLPCKFTAWDMDKNGYISMNEFAFAGHAAVKDKNTSVVFSKVDKNGDGKISRNELNKAPLLREKC